MSKDENPWPAPGFQGRFQQALNAAGKRQADVVRHFKITGTAVSKWAHGENLPSAKKCYQLADLLNVNFRWLFLNEGEMKADSPIPDLETTEGVRSMIDAIMRQIMDLNHRVRVLEDRLAPTPGPEERAKQDPRKGRRT